MNNHKLFFLLKCLSPAELKSFRDFIYSPFFNKSKKITALFERLISYYPDFEINNLTNEQLHNELFSGVKYNDATLRHLFSDLCGLSEKFLTEINFDKKFYNKTGCLIEELYLRGGVNIIDNYIKETDKFYSVNDEASSSVFLEKFKFETDRFNYLSLLPASFSPKNIPVILNALNSRNKHLIVFFVIEMVKSIDTINLVIKKNSVNASRNFTHDVLRYIDIGDILFYLINHEEMNEFKDILNTYYKLYRFFNNSDSELFYFEFKKTITENLNKFSYEEAGYFYKKLVDYCIKKNRSNNSSCDFDQELFSVYEDILKKKLFLDKHTFTFPAGLFRNILILSLRLKKTDWAEQFIYNYSDYLPSSQKTNLFNFSLASLLFEKSEFEKSLDYINKIHYNSISIKLDIKNLLLRIYYELDYEEPLYSLCSSYRELIKRNDSIPHSKGNSHRNFINYTEKLMFFKSSNDGIGLSMLRRQIENTEPLLNKRWLLEKAYKLINYKMSLDKKKFIISGIHN